MIWKHNNNNQIPKIESKETLKATSKNEKEIYLKIALRNNLM